MSCSVAKCNSHCHNTKNSDISLYRFPKDQKLQKIWVSKCKRKDYFNPENGRICSLHFKASDFLRDLQSELLGLPPKKKLKPNSIPSLNLLPGTAAISSVDSSPSTSSSIRLERRNVIKRAHERIVRLSPKKRKLEKSSQTENKDEMTVEKLRRENERLKIICSKTKKDKAQLKLKLLSLKKKLGKQSECREKRAVTMLEKLFSKKQIQCLLTGQQKVRWSKEDISKAIILRAVSRKAYQFLRKNGLPLPGISTLKRWLNRSFKIPPGLLGDVLKLLSNKAEHFSEEERLTVLSFDEMNVDSRISYDQEEDRIVGPHSCVQVVMARGLVSSWKCPIYYDFDTAVTRPLLKKIISEMASIHLNVVAIVSDLGPKNRSLWKELSISPEKTYFSHPDATKRVWVLADVPHLFKLLRNHFLDNGFLLPPNKVVSKDVIYRLLQLDNKEMKMCPKLSDRHLTVRGRDRQRVNLATQLFSNHVAEAIKFLIPGEEDCANFIKLTNDSFDILNSRKPRCQNECASAFGMHYDLQEGILKQFSKTIQEMKIGKHQKLLPFQNGILITINSLFGLYQELNIQYILTSRLNQDCLENLFSQIRGLGRFYDNPLPSEFKTRLKLLLVGANVNNISLISSPVEADVQEDCGYITSHLLENLPDTSEALEIIEGNKEMREIALESPSMGQADKSCTTGSVEGFRYLAGYLAFRCREHDPSLGIPSSEIASEGCDWIKSLSRGKLICPSEDWLEKMGQFEQIFSDFHGKSIANNPNIINNLCKKIKEKFANVPDEVIKMYARIRTFIRIRSLNNERRARRIKRAQKRKKRQLLASSK